VSPFAIYYEVTGAPEVEHHLLGIGDRAMEAEPALLGIAQQMQSIVEKRFEEEGPGWEPLAASTVSYKASHGLNPKILQATEEMKDSLTGAAGSMSAAGATTRPAGVLHLTHDELVFGTADPKAAFHQKGTARMPQRKILDFSTEDYLGFSREIQAYLMGLERAEFGVGEFGIASNAGIFG
jgi:phage gpG-like protein